MRYALISDIHANIEALDATLARIDELGADQIYCLGDLVGYHADPEACLSRLRERGIRSLAGNHDRAVAGLRSSMHFSSRARRAVAWTRKRLSPESLAYLTRLPVGELVDTAFFAVHAALHPEPNDQYHLTTKERVRASLDVLACGQLGSRLCFFGHTHRPAFHGLVGSTLESKLVEPDSVFELSPGAVHLINPGSVGQPRDGDQRASFAIYDSSARTVAFHRVACDWLACHDKARRAGLFDPEPAPVRGTFWVAARVDEGAGLIRRAIGRALR